MLKKLKFLICLVLIFFSQHIFAEEKTSHERYIGHLVNVTDPHLWMYTKFGAGGLWDLLGAALSDQEKKTELAKKIMSNGEFISIYSQEINKLLLTSGKFKAINILEPDLRYVGIFNSKDPINDPIGKWYGKTSYGPEKGEYFQNPNFRQDQEILIEFGLNKLVFTEGLGGDIETRQTDLLIKVIDKETSKLIVKGNCSIILGMYDYLNKDSSRNMAVINKAIQDSFFFEGWINSGSRDCISRIFNEI
jgi:hypothetical protein